jgi:diguanylate cyclase (GGDEF)-like protein
VTVHNVIAWRHEERRRDATAGAGPHIDLRSVFTFASVVVLPAPLLIGMIVAMRVATACMRRRPLHQVAFGTASILLSALAAHVIVQTLTTTRGDGIAQLTELGILIGAAGVHGTIQALLIGNVIRMTSSPRVPWKEALGTPADNALEAAMLLLGVVVGAAGWWWAPLVVAGPVTAATIALDRARQRAASQERLLAEHQAAIQSAIAERDKALDRASTEHRNACTDPLTQLLNRKGWAAGAVALGRHCADIGIQMFVLQLDLDHFKTINDRWGHPTGDKVLIKAAATVRGVVRAHDHAVVARLGGEEIVVAAPGDLTAGVVVAERIRAALAVVRVHATDHNGQPVVLAGRGNQPVRWDADGVPAFDHTIKASRAVSASIGAAHVDLAALRAALDASDTDRARADQAALELIEHAGSQADAALYQAKRVRNAVCAFTDDMVTVPTASSAPPAAATPSMGMPLPA